MSGITDGSNRDNGDYLNRIHTCCGLEIVFLAPTSSSDLLLLSKDLMALLSWLRERSTSPTA